MTQIRLHPAARRELHRAVDWYVHEAGKRIAASFIEDFNHLQSLIHDHPHSGTPGASHVRKLVFRRFPYTLVYRIRGDAAEVLALAHHGRHPEYWTGRL